MADKTDRRCFLARGIAGAAGAAAAYTSIEENTLRAAMAEGSATSEPQKPATSIEPGSLPCGKIGDVSLSRLLIGGNLIGGWAHARDLMYASKLFTAYNTESKVFETLDLCMACGINTIQLDPRCWATVVKYNKSRSENIQTMPCVGLIADKTKMAEEIKRQVDLGATFIYSHGGVTDNHMRKGGTTEVIAQMVELIQAEGLPAGVGGHSLNMPMACERDNVGADFYVKTYHGDRYWSATPEEHREEYDWMGGWSSDHNRNHDNMWCNNPEETAEFMAKVDKPWVAFKTMAAGAISPRKAFVDAFRAGADFILAGMFDFQVEADVRTAIYAFEKADGRDRPWCG